MAEAGILTEDDHVEVIEGESIQMAAIGSQHAACVGRLNQMVTEQLGAAARAHETLGRSVVLRPRALPSVSIPVARVLG